MLTIRDALPTGPKARKVIAPTVKVGDTTTEEFRGPEDRHDGKT
jgi:hypothetical protein